MTAKGANSTRIAEPFLPRLHCFAALQYPAIWDAFHMTHVEVTRAPPLFEVRLTRPQARNAVNRPMAEALARAFREFEADAELRVALLSGSGGPMGPTRMQLSKPVIAVVSGYCVAGGLELALWCDLRIADETAVFGVFCRRFGVPLIDGGTVRLPRLIGQSRALDMILTGREVGAPEALAFGLANRVVPAAQLADEARQLARSLAALPQTCLRNDRRSALQQWGLPEDQALRREFSLGLETLASGETVAGAARFGDGEGRHGRR
jgi:enoyl-CoA hydratase